jgi:hypothetical protein
MPVRQAARGKVTYDANMVRNPEAPAKIQKRTSRIITLRQERGYSATNYDGSAVKRQKTLRCQSGKFYDAKKVRNSQCGKPPEERSLTMPIW